MDRNSSSDGDELALGVAPRDLPRAELSPLSRHHLDAEVPAVGVAIGILFAYILRTATVTKRTAAITPFTTPEQEV